MKERSSGSVIPEAFSSVEVIHTRKLLAIYTAVAKGKPMDRHDVIAAIEGVGLAGDRYATKTGLFSGKRIPDADRQVTLIAREGIALANGLLLTAGNLPFEESETRSNLVIDIPVVELASLAGVRFRLGVVELEGVEGRVPCEWPSKLAGKSDFDKAYAGLAGLRARIVNGGPLRIGDAYVRIDAAMPR